MLDGVKPGAFGEHPAGKDPLLLAAELDLVHLDERGGVGCLGGRAGIADPWRHLQSAELHRLIDGNLEMRDPPRDLVEGGEHGDLVLDDLGLRQLRRQSRRQGQDAQGSERFL
jgi:hypothetical protein